jgi:dienelactone hydrolase
MRLLRRIVAIFVATVALGVACLFAFLGWNRRGDTTLPAPTGSFHVGRVERYWRNATVRPHPPAPDSSSAELVVWIWYPATNEAAPSLEYLPTPWLTVMQRGARFPFSLLRRDLAHVHAHSVRAPLSPERRRYPVVILRGGLGAKMLDYTTIAEDLASHGYVVVGFDAPYRTGTVVFPDGRVVTRPNEFNPETLSDSAQRTLANRLLTGWVADTRFALDELVRLDAHDTSGFAGRLDLDAIGVAGHSLGGATALQVCHDDRRCKAGIDIDGLPLGTVVRTGLDRPFMFLLSDHGADTATAEGRRVMSDLRAIYDKLPAQGAYWITIRGSGHFNFSDQALLLEPHLFRLVGGLGPIGERRALGLTTEYVHRFFDVYLGGAPRSAMRPTSRYPEADLREK